MLKLRVEGETGLSWTESNVPGMDQIDLSGKDWHAYDDSYGTDQEKHFIKYMHDQEARLRGVYDDFYLLRNEKAVKLYDFDTGRAFEPDFVLFLRKKGQEVSTIMQLFIEPNDALHDRLRNVCLAQSCHHRVSQAVEHQTRLLDPQLGQETRVSDLLCMSNLAHASPTKEHDDNDDFQGITGRTA